jgi:hypothetical protein
MILKTLLILSTCTLGIYLGTQLVEAILIVPYWKNLSPDNFFALYKAYGESIHQFYAPITIVAILLPTATLVCSLFNKSKTDLLIWFMFSFSVLFFSTFFLYFKEANLSFAQRTISNDALIQELIKWENWHWGSVVFEIFAFGSGLTLLLKSKSF